MDDQEKQDDFDDIVVEGAASEPGGCLGLVAALVISVLLMVVISTGSWTHLFACHLNGIQPLLFGSGEVFQVAPKIGKLAAYSLTVI